MNKLVGCPGDMSGARPLLGLALMLAAVGVVSGACGDGHKNTAGVANVVPIEAEPFALGDVRLLDGPFRDAMLLDQRVILDLDPDRLLHNFRVNAGIESSAEPLGGWEAPDVELRGHTLGHYLTACALMYAATGDERFKERADGAVAALADVQAQLPRQGFTPGYLSAFPEELFERVERRERVWAPYYTLHKIMQGLLDVHSLTGNDQALSVLLRMADWVKVRLDRLGDEQVQAMLGTEFGGMNDMFANLYAVTGARAHLELARRFEHQAVLGPLAQREDPLDGLHGNTQIPKIIGAAREYELTGERRYRTIATYFWERVARHRSYANGGNTDDERFFPVDEFAEHLSAVSSETCNTYNMLKLTRHLFSWSPSAETMDFYERGLFNQILASQDPETGMVIYYCPLKSGSFKTFSTAEDSFWCCLGSGMENHAKYGDTIYSRGQDSLWVNLFIASEVTWADKGLVVRQETEFPRSDATRLTVVSGSAPLALKIRYPAWATGIEVSVNGEAQPLAAEPGSYVTLGREWHQGDVVEVRLPMRLRAEPLPGNPGTVALMYGPVLLAGDLGTEGLEAARRFGPYAPELGKVATAPATGLVGGSVEEVLSTLAPVPGEPLHFRGPGLRPAGVELTPFYAVFEQRYTVYWDLFSESEWGDHAAELAAAEARRREVVRASVDSVEVGDEASEAAHGFDDEGSRVVQFEGRAAREATAGSFSYELEIAPAGAVTLFAAFRGSEGRNRAFDVLVDGEVVASLTLLYHPTGVLEHELPIPAALTRGKSSIRVAFSAQDGATAGALLDLRALQQVGGG